MPRRSGPARRSLAPALSAPFRWALAPLLGILLWPPLLGLAWPGDGAQARSPAPRLAEAGRGEPLKAVLLYNLARYTEWPAAAFSDGAAPLEVCVLGQDPFGPALDAIAGRPVGGRRVVVRRVDGAGDGPCHLMFIGASERARLAAILRSLEKRPVLSIAQMPDFARSGGIVSVLTDQEARISLEINVSSAGRAGLRLSSKLLGLGEIRPH